MPGKHLTYAKAGVSISRGDRLVQLIRPLVRLTRRDEVLSSVGGFGALTRIPRRYRDPVLVTSTDGVGTKVRLALELRKFDSVGIDLVAMSVNDILTLGAEPLLFLDYFATGRLRLKRAADLIRGIAVGCRQAGCALVGGETAEMPQVYKGEDFDLAGFCVGVADRNRIVDGRRMKSGDAVIGLPSSGIHSNGYSLVREILLHKRISLGMRRKAWGRENLGALLLKPTRIYVREVLSLLRTTDVRAMSHITGGGIVGNLPRVLPKGYSALLQRGSWRVPPIFAFLQEAGNVRTAEMFRTFNMGIGYVLIVAPQDAARVLKKLKGARRIGSIVQHRGGSRVSWKN